jgi:hypothetical protein
MAFFNHVVDFFNNRMCSSGEGGGTGDSLRPAKGHVKSASVSSSGPEPASDPLRTR